MDLLPVLLRLHRFSRQFEFHFLQQSLVRFEIPFGIHISLCGAGAIFSRFYINTLAFPINDSPHPDDGQKHQPSLLNSGLLLQHRFLQRGQAVTAAL